MFVREADLRKLEILTAVSLPSNWLMNEAIAMQCHSGFVMSHPFLES